MLPNNANDTTTLKHIIQQDIVIYLGILSLRFALIIKLCLTKKVF